MIIGDIIRNCEEQNKKIQEELNAHDGVSAFQVNTPNGMKFMQSFKENAFIHAARREDVAVENPAILYENKESIPELRKEIYQKIKHDGWNAVEKKYLRCKNYYLKKAWYAMPDGLTRAIKKVMKG